MTKENAEWLKISDCAKHLGYSSNALRAELEKDKVPLFKLNRTYRIRKTDFDNFCKTRIKPIGETKNE